MTDNLEYVLAVFNPIPLEDDCVARAMLAPCPIPAPPPRVYQMTLNHPEAGTIVLNFKLGRWLKRERRAYYWFTSIEGDDATLAS